MVKGIWDPKNFSVSLIESGTKRMLGMAGYPKLYTEFFSHIKEPKSDNGERKEESFKKIMDDDDVQQLKGPFLSQVSQRVL